MFVISHAILFFPIDLRRLNSMAMKAAHTGMIIVGGGVIKHHICNANLMVSLQGNGFQPVFRALLQSVPGFDIPVHATQTNIFILKMQFM
jgi:hypothetical protein